MSTSHHDFSFDTLRLRAHSEAAKAALAPGLTDLQRAQAHAVAGLAGLILHRVVGDPDADDAKAFIDDLEAICRHVDTLVEAIGAEAKRHFGSAIDMNLFRGQLRGTLEGNATFDLEQAAERAEKEAREIEAHPRGWAKAAEFGVD